jgi:hypothetical protein
VARAHPHRTAKIDNDKRKEKQYCMRFVTSLRPSFFIGVARKGNDAQHKAGLRRAYQSAFCPDDKKQNSRSRFNLP